MATSRSNPSPRSARPVGSGRARAARVTRVFQSVFPPPRRGVTPSAIVPLLAFLVVYAAVIGGLELFNTVSFTAPWAFALMALAPWFWWMHVAGYSGLRGGRATAAFLCRMLLLGIVVAMIAEPRAVQKNERMAVIFAVDVSPSIARELQEEALTFVSRVATSKPPRDEAGLVVFSREAAVELPPAMSFPFEAINARVSPDGTNIEKGLSLAAALVKDDTQGRIVLVTDGVSTEGTLPAVLDDLRSRGIAVDVLPIQYDYQNEVWIERLQLPKLVKTGETYEAAAIISSIAPGKGKLILQENDQVIFEEEVEFEAGKNRFAIPLPMRDPGFYEYTASIELPHGQDGVPDNNRAISYLYLQGEGKVLVVTDPQGNPLDWQPMVEALQRAERRVEVVTAYEVPREPLGLLPYDCVVFANVGADLFDTFQLRAVHDAVRNQGSGFLMVGGENSFGPGGYHRTAIEDVLPVTMDITQRKVMPKAALAVLLHTCEFAQGNTWAKQITKQAIKVLSEFDEAGALSYGGGISGWIFPLTPVSEYEEMAIKINGAEIWDMPDFAQPMRLALQGLKNSDAATKHMIMISDGDPAPPSAALLKEFADNNISITTVVVFPHEIPQNSPAGLTLPVNHPMVVIPRLTGGKHYLLYAAGDEKRLPSIFIREAKTLRRSMIQNKEFVPAVGYPSQILKDINAVPKLNGYVITTIKGAPAANVLLVPDSEDQDPVLARWNYGIGKSAAFTSDLSPRWGADWLNWEQYEAFVRQLITDISRVQQAGNLRIDTFPAGSEGVVIIEDHAEEARFLEMAAVVDGPDGNQQVVPLKQTGPRRYEGRFPLTGIGRYQIMATTQNGSVPDDSANLDPDGEPIRFAERVHGGFALPYSQEFMRFRADPITIEQITNATDGRILTPEMTGKEVYGVDRTVRRSSSPVADVWWLWLLIALLVLHDVGIRRVQMDWALVGSWFRSRSSGESQQTLDALRRRKETVSTQLKSRDEATPLSPRPMPTKRTDGLDLTAAAPTKPTTKPKADDQPQEPTDTTSTTERLLALKRKQREKDN